MSDDSDDTGILTGTRELARTWINSKKRALQNRGTPQTQVDTVGGFGEHEFTSQDIDPDELREIKRIRESGGVVASLVRDKALMQAGTGVEWEAENDEVAEWLDDQFDNLDNLLIDICEDAIWFPYSLGEIVETAGGEFSHVELIEPWTMTPETDAHGEIQFWEQNIGPSHRDGEIFQPDEIASFVLTKASGRDKTGISEVKRAEDEIRSYKENEESITKAVEVAAFPHIHWSVGREGASPLNDNELRRFRNVVTDPEGDTQWITGPDVDANRIDAADFNFKNITEHDLRKLALALGVPLELASVISEGLGSGEQSGVRMQAFERQSRARQRSLGDQFVEQVVRPILERYSPYSAEENVTLKFGDPVQDRGKKQAEINAIGDDMTVNERRQLFDRAPIDDTDEVDGDSFERASDQEAPEDSGGGPGGLFGSDAAEQSDFESSGLETTMADGGGSGNSDWGVAASEDTPEWDRHLLELHQRLFEADNETRLLDFVDTATPEFVKERIRDTILSGVVFSDIEGIPSGERMNLQEHLLEALTSDGWTIDGVADQLMSVDGINDREYAELVAESETAAILNTSRANGYQEEGQGDGLFYWAGELGPRTTEACRWLIERTNPRHGGEPVPMDELKALIAEAPEHDDDMDDDLARPDSWMVHPRERKTFVRAPRSEWGTAE